MPQRAIITSLPEAMNVVKEMRVHDPEWNRSDWRSDANRALKAILEDRMRYGIDNYLDELSRNDSLPDRRNGSYKRYLLTELGEVELDVFRTRRFSAAGVIKAYARRSESVDKMILGCFLLGLSTRKVSEALLPVLGERVSASTVSRISKILDESVAAFHKRKLKNIYKALIFDGVVLSRKTGAGALKRPVLVVLGITHDNKKEVIDFRLAASESEKEWEMFLNDLYDRGLTGEGVEILCVDGGKGLLAAFPIVYPDIPVQRCWAHKMRNITDKVRKKDREMVKKGLHKIYNAENITAARSAARKWADKWKGVYPKAVKCLRNDLDDLLAFFKFKDPDWRKATRTTNAIERRFREVKRRTRPMGVFSDKTSMERILFAIFTRENKLQGTFTPFLMTHNN
ncbi:MAG: IS256 family transposase [Nitrospinota bacterium]